MDIKYSYINYSGVTRAYNIHGKIRLCILICVNIYIQNLKIINKMVLNNGNYLYA